MLDDLDSVDWAALSHAYGPAGDVPGLLRDLAGGSEDALYDLFGNIWHQGTVYEATAFAVPYLVRILSAPGADTVGILGLLAAIARGSSYMDVHQGYLPGSEQDTDEVRAQVATELSWVAAARAAVAAGMPTYLRLLATDPDGNVRTAAADPVRALGRPGADDGATPALRQAATGDDSEVVRATAVLALGARGEAVDAHLADPAPLPRLAAAVVAASVGPLPEPVVEAVERDAPASLPLIRRLPTGSDDPLTWVVGSLGTQWDVQIRLLTAWLRHPDDEVRSGAAAAAAIPLLEWRPAAAHLVPALAVALSDPSDDVRRWAGRHLAGAGRANAAVADELWAAVDRGPAEPGVSALIALSRLHDPRADGWLAARLSRRAGLEGLHPAVEALGPWATACRAVVVDAIAQAPRGNERIELILAAARTGAPAADLVPVLRQQAPSHPHATSRVLGDLGPASAAALPELTALRTSTDLIVRVNAARAIWRITGDPDDLLGVLRANLGQHHALEVLAEMGPAGAGLADLLPPMFDADYEWRAVCAAAAYWRLTGDAARVVPVLVRHVEGRPVGMVAVRCLAEIGTAAAAALPKLREAVDSPYRQVEWAIGDTGILEDEAWIDACGEALARIGVRDDS